VKVSAGKGEEGVDCLVDVEVAVEEERAEGVRLMM
jgi:hypothetical protein